MKKLLGILVLGLLIFASPSYTTDIRDFEVEGMSIGDTLLDYLSANEIENREKLSYGNNKFDAIIISKVDKSLQTYDSVQITYQKARKIIHGLAGNVYFDVDINQCYAKQKKIVKELNNLFQHNSRRTEQNKQSHIADKTGKSTFTAVNFDLNFGGGSRVICYDWSEKATQQNGWIDSLTVIINSNEFDKFLSSEAYK